MLSELEGLAVFSQNRRNSVPATTAVTNSALCRRQPAFGTRHLGGERAGGLESAGLDHPRRDQPEGQLHQIGIAHRGVSAIPLSLDRAAALAAVKKWPGNVEHVSRLARRPSLMWWTTPAPGIDVPYGDRWRTNRTKRGSSTMQQTSSHGFFSGCAPCTAQNSHGCRHGARSGSPRGWPSLLRAVARRNGRASDMA